MAVVIERTVDGADSPLLDDYRMLADPERRKMRERDEIFVAEGLVAIERLVESEHEIRSILVTPTKWARLRPLVEGAAGGPIEVFVAPAELMYETVGFKLHRGAVASAARRPLPSVAEVAGAGRRLVVLEGLNDPENVGAVARTARAFGCDGMILDPTCIDPYYRRTVRVSMGEVLLMSVARSDDWPGDLDLLRDLGWTTWAMTPAPDATVLWTTPVPDRLAIVFGAEGPGLSPPAMAACTNRVRIPISPAVDSLNVGAAAAITLAHTTTLR